jgi:hypothetical protein
MTRKPVEQSTQTEDFRFPVELIPMQGVLPRGKTVDAPMRQGVYRKDTKEIITTVGGAYHLVPHTKAVDFFEEAFHNNGIDAERVNTSVLRNGQVLYARYLMPEERDVSDYASNGRRKGDVLRVGFILRNSLDGSCKLKFMTDAERLACSNGMTTSHVIAGTSMIHRGDQPMEERCAEVNELLDIFDNEVLPTFGEFMDQKVTKDDARKFFATLNVADKHRLRIYERFIESKDLTFWGAFNAVTAQASHVIQHFNFGKSRQVSAQAFKLLWGGLHGYTIYDPKIVVTFDEETTKK